MTIARPSDWMMPLPKPCKARAEIRNISLPARPQSHDPKVKSTNPRIYIRLLPMRSAIQPAEGSMSVMVII